MARERRAKQITMILELEDNCGAVLKRRKKTVELGYTEGKETVTEEGTKFTLEEFKKFVDSIPDKLEI